MFEAIILGYRWFFLQLAGMVGYGWGIVALSVITSAAMMPLMKAVAGVVRRETEYQGVILPQIAEINRRYGSDIERNLHIQRLYARYGYSPLSAVKKVLPLFVQIPFLLLTYFMLKGTAQLAGVSFLFLRDLGLPDALAHGLNLLPLAMTGVNLITVAATPGFTNRDQIQAVAIALLFLVMLYTAPSALLLYWTLNNLITCIRTLLAEKGKGARLLITRIVSVKWNVPMPLVSMAVLVVALYFSIFVKLSRVFEGSLNFTIALKTMAFVAALFAVSTVPLRWRNGKRSAVLLTISLVVNLGFAAILAGLYCFSRFYFTNMLEWVEMSAAVWCMLLVAILPLAFGRRGTGADLLLDWRLGIKQECCWLLLPIVFTIHYSFASAVFTLPLPSVLLLAIYMAGACILLYTLLMLTYREWFSPDKLFKIAVGVLTAIYIFPMVAGEGIFSDANNLPIRLLLMGIVPAIMLRVAKVRTALVFMVVLLLTSIANSFINHGKDMTVFSIAGEDYAARLRQVVGDAHCVRSNNVYLLVYDSYPHQSVIDGLNLDDASMMDDLRENGFKVYDAYSSGADTITSMSSAFTLGGVAGMSQKATMGGDNIFSDFLREAGYKTAVMLCGYDMPIRGERMPADFYYPNPAEITRPELVLLPCIFRGTLSQSPTVFNSYSHDDWMTAYYGIMAQRTMSKCFVYAHNDYPGHAAAEPRFRKSDAEEQSAFRLRLRNANADIRQTLRMLEQDRDSIVIIASDHGAAMMIPEKGSYDARHLIDHYGIMLAIRWPADYQPVLQLNCLQNVLLEVMIYLSGDTKLAKLENAGTTVELLYPIGAPKGLVEHGVLQTGEFKGQTLFDVARRVFQNGH